MGQEINKHGLSRYIPSEVKREVRRRSGFGCVVCGTAFGITYEHIDPPFKNAKQHKPQCMTLLCGSCQIKSTAKLLSKETIKYASAHPKSLQKSFSSDTLDIGRTHPEVVIGTLYAKETTNIIRVFGEPILCIDAPEQDGAPFSLSAVLTDRNENDILIIDENEWQNPTISWDVEVVGQHITIRRALRDILLVLRIDPPYRIVVERLDSYYDGLRLTCREGQPFRAILSNGAVFETQRATLTNCKTAVDVLADGLYIGADCESFYGDIITSS